MYEREQRIQLARELADAFVTARWNPDEVAEAGAGCLDRWPEWMSALSLQVVAVHRRPPSGSRELTDLIETFLTRRSAAAGESEPPCILRLLAVQRPVLDHRWPVAEIGSVGELAQRLELSDGQLAWLADVRGLERTVTQAKLRNYRYWTRARRGAVPRVIEAPKARLKEIQRWLLHEIIDHVPPHDAAHGFVRGRSVISHARLHCDQDVVLRFDLKDFFASIPAARVYGILRTAGYAPPVAHVLTGLSTNVVAQTVWTEISAASDPTGDQSRFWLGRQLATPHLPQGAPTSPALANLAAFGLDRRLTGLAGSWQLRYSRYADDLTFSGSSRLRRSRVALEQLVAKIAREEGFAINPRKSALRGAAGRQQVCGIVVNIAPNVTRTEYDTLKATLHHAAREGPERQNRAGVADLEAHLRGRIAWVASLNPHRGDLLRRRFAEIDWPAHEH